MNFGGLIVYLPSLFQMMYFNQKHTVAEISKRGLYAPLALQRYSFGSRLVNKPLEVACRIKGLNSRFLVDILESFENLEYDQAGKFSSFPTPVIVDYLRRTHQLYLLKKLPEIEQSINHLVFGYQYHQPYLVAIKALFKRYKQNLEIHIQEEEKKFFPHALYVYDQYHRGGCLSKFSKKLQKYSANDFAEHHDDTETELMLIRKAIIKYAPKEVEESLHRVLISQIETFIHDLKIHAMIEDEVLVPKIKELEQKAMGNQLNYKLITK